MNTSRRMAFFLITLSVSVLAVACGESKVSQCNRIIAVVNKASGEAQAAGKSDNPDRVGNLENVANSIDQYAQELEAVQVKDETLQGLQSRLIQMYQETSKAIRSLVEGARKKDNQAVTASIKSLKQANQKESSLVDEFNQYCRGK